MILTMYEVFTKYNHDMKWELLTHCDTARMTPSKLPPHA